ncbi:MAG: hypothetical protein HY040_17505 [Planctomycetes bacterium]|nr:hypothetical protein [Planctomycetota bacterium]MBI3410142.1 hypothetical protein [Planctomycetota bacterium]
MKLPNGDKAFLDARKVADYCLNPDHEDGKHKARLFQELLGFGPDDAPLLLDALKHAASTQEAVPGKGAKYGQRYVVDFELHGPSGSATIRSAWIIRVGESNPRLETCYIL